ncbi:MAG: response regulator [Spirulinaceae cyanobacterium]
MNIPFKNIRLMIVDDHQDSQDLLVTLFEAYGAEVRAVASVSEAWQLLKWFRPHLLISDLVMPEQDGYSFIHQIRQVERRKNQAPLPAIALTAAAKPEDRDRALDAGFTQYLSKPVNLETLMATVSQLIQVCQSA